MFPYGRLEPLGIMVGLAADFAELADGLSVSDWSRTAEKVALSVTQNLSNKTFLSGLSNLLNAVQDPERYGKSWTQRIVGSAVPAVVAAATRATDPILRRPESLAETIQARLPFLSQAVLPRRDHWGEPLTRGAGPGPVERFVSPVQRRRIERTPADLELLRLNVKIGTPSRTLTFGQDETDLTPQEYDRYQHLAGQKARQLVNNRIRSSAYRHLPDEVKADAIRESFTIARQWAQLHITRQFKLLRRARMNPAQPPGLSLEARGLLQEIPQ